MTVRSVKLWCQMRMRFPLGGRRKLSAALHHETDSHHPLGRCTFSRSILAMTTTANPARSQAAANTRKLIDWAVEEAQKPRPEPVRRRAAIILSDDIGAMVAGSLETQVAKAREGLLRTSSGKVEATVLAQGAPRTDRYAAASANGMAITWCELDEGFRNASCHGGAYTIPALLAEAEAQGRSVEEVLRALAVAYEVTTRSALAFPFPVFNVHPHAAFATIGGAAAASLVRKQDAKTVLSAVTGAASMSFAGPFDTPVAGALIRNAWTSAGAWIGLRAADWAEAGIGGNDVTPYDVFVGAYKCRAMPEKLIEGLGDTWSVTNGYHKVFACCGYAHSAIEATLDILGRMHKKKDDIAEIVVETAPGGPALRNAELRERVRLQPYPDLKPAPNDRPARVTMRFGDGDEVSAVVESARGGYDKPFDEPTLLSKLAENAGGVFPAAPTTLANIIRGDSALLSQPWPDVLAR